MTETRLSTAYWRLWWAAGISNAGDGAFAAAVPLLAVTVTRDPRLVSLVSAATYVPWLLLSLPVGALVDRSDRAGLMWRSQVVQAAIVGTLAILAAYGQVSVALLALVTFGLGTCEVVFTNSAQAILPEIVPRSLLHKANGTQQTIMTVGQLFLGPPLGSLLFATAVGLPFGLDAASFALSAALLATLPRSRRHLDTQHPPVRAAVADGLRWLGAHRLLRTLALLLGVNTFCFQLGNATLVLLATRTLHVSTRAYGLLLAVSAVGSLLGGLLNAPLVGRFGALPALLAALTANVAVFVGVGLSPNVAVLGALLAANALVTMVWNVVSTTIRQQIVPTELMGRVNSVYRMLGWGLMPLGALASGLLAHGIGLRAPYVAGGVLRGIALLAALPVLVSAMRQR